MLKTMVLVRHGGRDAFLSVFQGYLDFAQFPLSLFLQFYIIQEHNDQVTIGDMNLSSNKLLL